MKVELFSFSHHYLSLFEAFEVGWNCHDCNPGPCGPRLFTAPYIRSLSLSTCLSGSQLSCQCTECNLGKSINSTLGQGVRSARVGGRGLVGGGGKNRGTFLKSLQLALRGFWRESFPLLIYLCELWCHLLLVHLHPTYGIIGDCIQSNVN